MIKLIFHDDPLERKAQEEELESDARLQRATKKDMTKFFLYSINRRMKEEGNILLSYYGKQECLSGDTIIYPHKKGLSEMRIERPIRVFSFNTKDNKIEKDKAMIINSGIKQLYEIKTENNKTIRATAKHKFFVFENGKIREKMLKDLIVGDRLLNFKTSKITYKLETISSIRKIDEEQTYDLKVEKNHNFILDNGILTHNSGKSIGALWTGWVLSRFSGGRFSADFVYRNRVSLIEDVKKARRYDTFILDELKKLERTIGKGSRRLSVTLSDIESEVRAYQVNFLFCAPFVEPHAHYYILRAWRRCRTEDEEPMKYKNGKVIMEIDRETGDEIPKYENRKTQFIIYQPNTSLGLGKPFGYVITGKPPQNIFDAYMKKKFKGVKETLLGVSDKRVDVLLKNAEKLVCHVEWLDCKYRRDKEALAFKMFPDLGNKEREFLITEAEKIKPPKVD